MRLPLFFPLKDRPQAMYRILAIVLLAVVLGAVPTGWAQELSGPSVTVTGYVQDSLTGAPIVEALVQVGETSLHVDNRGAFGPVELGLAASVADVAVLVTADGYAPGNFGRLTLHEGQPVELWLKLERINDAPRQESIDPWQGVDAEPDQPQVAQPAASALVPFYMDPNREIRIARTFGTLCDRQADFASLPVQSMRFGDYVRNVLPNEWAASWPSVALDAGAVAVKQYAWYTAFIQRKWNTRFAFDLLDSTCDQVYKDNSFHPATDAAVERTWWVTLNKNGNLFATFYRAYDSQCPAIPGCMGQYGSRDAALAGQSLYEILHHYYSPAVANIPGMDQQLYLPIVQH